LSLKDFQPTRFNLQKGDLMQFLSRRFTLSTLAACALGAFSALGALAQDYPNKPIRIIAPFPTGTGPDANTREIALELTKVFGQTVVVENRPGASSMIGIDSLREIATRHHHGCHLRYR